jgi:hypothetical protein
VVHQQFSIWKRAIFRKVKEIKGLSGGVVLYAAQSNPQVGAEIAEKGRFRTKTRLGCVKAREVNIGHRPCRETKNAAPKQIAIALTSPASPHYQWIYKMDSATSNNWFKLPSFWLFLLSGVLCISSNN